MLIGLWSLRGHLIGPPTRLKNESCDSKVTARIHSQYEKNDRSGVARLSKIAHKLKPRLRCKDRIKA